MREILVKIFLLTIVVGVAFASARRDSDVAGFVLDSDRPIVVRETSYSEFSPTLLPTTTASCHSSSVAPIADGRFCVVWYGGRREGARDVNIYATTVDGAGTSTAPRVVLDRETLARQTGRSIRKLGNPVVFAQRSRLWLFVVSVSYGGWSGSSINVAFSDDDGETWSPFRRLRTTPIFNISSLVRSSCVARTDGGFELPAYCELATKYGLSFVFDADGRLVDRAKIPIEKNAAALQPSIVPLDAANAVAFSRVPSGGIGASTSSDGGATWRATARLPLENRDSSVAAFRLKSGETFIVGNSADADSNAKRSRLVLWKATRDDFSAWKTVAELENERGAEFSYPSALVVDDRVFLTYTWKRRAIKMIELTSVCEAESAAALRQGE